MARRRQGVHDLGRMLDSIEREYFPGGPMGARIVWGRWPRGATPHWGRCDFDRGIISICPVLDRSWVPAYFVGHIVMHELVHFVRDDGAHDEGFCAAVARYRHHERALAWEQRNLSRLYRAAARRQ